MMLRPLKRPHIVVERHWDGSVCETQASNGRVYISRGRWQWLVIVDGVTDSAHDRCRAARARALYLQLQGGESPR